MKKLIEFIIFNNSISKVKERTPSVAMYRKYLNDEWRILGEACLDASPDKVKKILPLKSLVITAVIGSSTFIRFNKSEFDEIMKRKINESIVELINEYHSQKFNNKYEFYIDNKETFQLLLDAINEGYHLENEEDSTQLVAYLHNELNHSQTNRKRDKNVKQRMEIELEFIKRRKETQSF